MVRRTQPFVTKKEVSEFPNIREKTFENLEIAESFDYKITTFKGEKYERIIDENRFIDPRIALLTNNVSGILSEKYNDYVFLVLTPRGDMFVFSKEEDPRQIIGKIIATHIGLLSQRFDAFDYKEKQISKVITVISE